MPQLVSGLPAGLVAALAGFLGLLVGSFLNVVIYRLPKIMERQWVLECAEMSGTALPTAEPFNLMVPRSRCSSCGHVIAWHENIPVLSYLFLKGQCSACGSRFGLRYPLVELTTGALFFFCAWRWGLSWTALAWSGFSAVLVALAMIDWDTTLLPDDLTLPMLWAGLIVAALGWNPMVALSNALWGAVAGYLSLWLVYWAFKLVTGKEGMGYGDFKLFAALGAWFGWSALVPMILMASVIGALVGIAMKFSSGLREGGVVPFGPFLAGAGLTAMLFGPQSILRFIGL
ncbi:MAG: A24 family peptidase [Pseudomonadota bacterium]|uniref:prepilin peptidase n=1 Tax=Polaromonas sp. TaxID=1869339 RepID=UPI00181FF0B3|nr:A24 family peptidase [Polaromonas sp.]MBA3593168.1 prepilin peptidase [Polaromonas sp.]MDQ3271115.1 A24 family peptidase [Pseudomonadota bacterium]